MPGPSEFNKSAIVLGLLISLLLVLFIGGWRRDHGLQRFDSLRLPHGAAATQLDITTNVFTSGQNKQPRHELPAAWAETLRARAEGPKCKLFDNGQSVVRMTNITDGPHMFGYFDKVRSWLLRWPYPAYPSPTYMCRACGRASHQTGVERSRSLPQHNFPAVHANALSSFTTLQCPLPPAVRLTSTPQHTAPTPCRVRRCAMSQTCTSPRCCPHAPKPFDDRVTHRNQL